MILAMLDEAVRNGARQQKACELLGLDERTVQRWRRPDNVEDGRILIERVPANKLREEERQHILKVVNSPEYRDLSPKQIVPRLADEGTYLASEASLYRLLRAEGQMTHRQRSRPPVPRPRPEHVASAPNQVWTWDITYLKSQVRGSFYYLYVVVDVYSRRIMRAEVHESESMELSARMIRHACRDNEVEPAGLVLHSDNGGPMKGSTMLATLQVLGIVPSFSRPRVSDDNPYSEALFRTLKYRPAFPERPFESLAAAQAWVERFVGWYNTEHLHSAIRFVTPDQRYRGEEQGLLASRHALYTRARARQPERWSGATRNWQPVRAVYLNPRPASSPPLNREAA